MSGLSGIGNGGYNPYAAQQFQQNLFSQITNGSGSLTKSELESAVSSAGGTTQAADALYSELDPNNTGSVSEQQFSQVFPGPPYSNQMQSQMISYQAQGWPGASTAAPAAGWRRACSRKSTPTATARSRSRSSSRRSRQRAAPRRRPTRSTPSSIPTIPAA